jgi:hypothetical protein
MNEKVKPDSQDAETKDTVTTIAIRIIALITGLNALLFLNDLIIFLQSSVKLVDRRSITCHSYQIKEIT